MSILTQGTQAYALVQAVAGTGPLCADSRSV